MGFTIKDLEYLEYAIKNKDRCRIIVDNNTAWIEECINKDDDMWVVLYPFKQYGDCLIAQLFGYIGCDCDLK